MNHLISQSESGATCSCGKEFNVWRHRQSGWRSSNDISRQKNLARANAHRHAAAANRREGQES